MPTQTPYIDLRPHMTACFHTKRRPVSRHVIKPEPSALCAVDTAHFVGQTAHEESMGRTAAGPDQVKNEKHAQQGHPLNQMQISVGDGG